MRHKMTHHFTVYPKFVSSVALIVLLRYAFSKLCVTFSSASTEFASSIVQIQKSIRRNRTAFRH